MKFVPRNQAEKFFSSHFDEIRGIILGGARDDYNNCYLPEAKRAHDTGLRAQCRQGQMLHRAKLWAESKPSVVKKFDANGLEGVIVGDYSLIFKKFDSDLKTRNASTPHIDEYFRQRSLLGIEALWNFVGGYTENGYGLVDGVYMICPKGRFSRYYEFNLTPNEASSVISDMFVDIDQLPEEPTITPIVAPEPVVDEPTINARKESAEILKFEPKKEDESKS